MSKGPLLAIIPARLGSKGIPQKNLAPLNGHPLLAYSIAAAKESRNIDRIWVSTESEQIAMTARTYGAEVPYLRAPEFAQDLSPDIDFLQEALIHWDLHQAEPLSHFVLLRPTSPLRAPGFIDKVIEHFYKIQDQQSVDSLRSIVRSPKTPYKMWKKDGDLLVPIIEGEFDGVEGYNSPRQILPAVWLQAGAIDIISAAAVRAGSASGKNITYFEMDGKDFCDIDTVEDLQSAERRLKSGSFIQIDDKNLLFNAVDTWVSP